MTRKKARIDEETIAMANAACVAIGGPKCYDNPFESAVAIGLWLACAGIEHPLRVATGTVRQRTHYWVILGEPPGPAWVVDPTAGRFGATPPAPEEYASDSCWLVDFCLLARLGSWSTCDYHHEAATSRHRHTA